MRKPFQYLIKRIADILAAGTAVLIFSPLLVVISAAIKLTSPGPILFCQQRLGRSARIFKLYKFRTMVPNAERIGAGLSVTEDDDRITKFGAFLRKTSLDELPQLFNVLKGDISLVGPRPTVPQHLEYYGPFEKKRLEMKPGMTGLSMIRGRANNPWSIRIKYDVEYIENFSLWLDCKILWKTIWVVLKRENTYYDYEKHTKPPFDLVKPGPSSHES